MGRFPFAAALALLAAPLCAGVEITASDGRVDVSAAQAPLSDVLDGLARKTRMKVVYDGATPRTPVTVDLRRRTPAEAVIGVLEGQGVNYMLALDVSGTQVETLMIVGAGATGGGFAPSGSAGAFPSHAGRRDTQRARDEEPVATIEDAVEYEAGNVAPPHEVPKVEEPKPSPPPGPLNPTFPPGMAPMMPGPPPMVIPSPSPSPVH
jgi:hypothetical protein